MKLIKIFSFYFLFLSTLIMAQDRKVTKTGEVNFEASVPSFEEVAATNTSVSCILNAKTGEIASLALIKGFRFKVALMEEHFNENYLESNKYPKAIFKGMLKDFNIDKLGSTLKEYEMKGKLDLHGKSKEINTTALLRRNGDIIEVITNFIVNTDDFDITIPKVVSNKLSKKINIKSKFLLR
ncbi:YceI-like domain-containing protein [Flavobacterium gillisiae]|uniref:YceI-like domain-containing protein n=2 Tax=Flavobacterium gillisiae TaxID=150146 RepID=A0A1H4FFN7_9FLAO|nr:YceI-like domain-containing protein [Flavobacterium gillisiae]